MKGILVPVLLFICVTYGFRLLVDAVVRVLMLRAGTSDEAVRLLIDEAREGRWLGALQLALNLIGVALPLLLMQPPHTQELSWHTVAGVAIGLGLANLALAVIARRYRSITKD